MSDDLQKEKNTLANILAAVPHCHTRNGYDYGECEQFGRMIHEHRDLLKTTQAWPANEIRAEFEKIPAGEILEGNDYTLGVAAYRALVKVGQKFNYITWDRFAADVRRGKMKPVDVSQLEPQLV